MLANKRMASFVIPFEHVHVHASAAHAPLEFGSLQISRCHGTVHMCATQPPTQKKNLVMYNFTP